MQYFITYIKEISYHKRFIINPPYCYLRITFIRITFINLISIMQMIKYDDYIIIYIYICVRIYIIKKLYYI